MRMLALIGLTALLASLVGVASHPTDPRFEIRC